MAGSSFFMLLDDIAAVADDVAIMAKTAAKKTAGVLGDDLALNAQQVSGTNPNRELPVVWAVFKGSMLNKLILVPMALLISYFASWLITPLLILGGTYLCFEGFEKVYHQFFHKKESERHEQEHKSAIKNTTVDMVKFEKDKIKGAVRTDFILSAEIIAITLGVVKFQTFLNQFLVLSFVGFIITVAVYGIVAAIVRLDDIGFWLQTKNNQLSKKLGLCLILMTPYLMKLLSIFGTLAMFLVGGGIISHGIGFIHHAVEVLVAKSGSMSWITQMLLDASLGLLAGGLTLVAVTCLVNLKNKIFIKK